MDIENIRRQSIKDEQRRQSLKTEQLNRHQVVMSQPRNSIGSEISSEKTTTLSSPLSGGGFGDLALMTLRAKRVSNRLRRKSVNPKIDPPPGLEGINDKGFVYVRQQMDMDLKGGCGSANTYKIWDENEEELFYVLEDATCCCRWFCGPNRQFRLDFFTPQDDLVFSLHRKCCRCDWCCCLDCFMCNHKVYVVDCLSRTLGSIRQKFSICRSKFDVVDSQGNIVAKILGPICPCRCCTEITFEVTSFHCYFKQV
ncbi:hypothetical protein KUTeg_012591 [Tegillarca granosa]|uniref:Phospholipid scramblase n=1 Tax=Tegillarca granosa TaxID=220873 RepID=A0ABQ9F2G4_TEGGR|nr:hypothetical protein KUTeg_012591 [Tegillarca granosa]